MTLIEMLLPFQALLRVGNRVGCVCRSRVLSMKLLRVLLRDRVHSKDTHKPSQTIKKHHKPALVLSHLVSPHFANCQLAGDANAFLLWISLYFLIFFISMSVLCPFSNVLTPSEWMEFLVCCKMQSGPIHVGKSFRRRIYPCRMRRCFPTAWPANFRSHIYLTPITITSQFCHVLNIAWKRKYQCHR